MKQPELIMVPGTREGRMEELDRSKPLRDMGVPEDVIRYIEEQKPSAGRYLAYQALTFALLIAGFVAGALLWGLLNAFTIANAVKHTHAVGGLMYHANFGFSGVLSLFVWILVSAALANVAIVGSRARATYFAFTVATQPPLIRGMIARDLKKLAGRANDPKDYVDRWIDRGNKQLIVAVIVGIAVCAYALSRDVNANTVYTAAAYIRSPFFPWSSTAPHPWSTASRVELGCNHVTGKNASDYLVYRVSFPDGAHVSLESAAPLPNLDWLEVAEGIDAQIRDGGARFERWDWLDRDPLHPGCLAVMRRNFGADYPRIERLLRIGELPDR